MNRTEIFNRIDDEREYQKEKWGDTPRSAESFLLLIEQYVNKATYHAAYLDNKAQENFREIAALAVAAAEQHGMDYRDWPRK